jgi:hypothetical protein
MQADDAPLHTFENLARMIPGLDDVRAWLAGLRRE